MNCLPVRKRKHKSRPKQIELTSINKRWNSCNIDTDVIFNNGTSVDGFMGLEELHDYDEDEITNLCKKKKQHTLMEKDIDFHDNNSEMELSSSNSVVSENNKINVQSKDVISNFYVTSNNETDREVSLYNENKRAKPDKDYSNDGDKDVLNDGDKNGLNDGDKTVLNDVDKNVLNDGDKNVLNDRGKNNLSNSDCEQIKCDTKIIMDGDNRVSNMNGTCAPTKVLSKKERRSKQGRKLSFKLKLKERRKKFKEMKRLKACEDVTLDKICDKVISKCESFEMKSNVRSIMSDWSGLGVPDEVLKALSEHNFLSPTPIQRECLPQAIFHRQDIIGAAETGSGKTLAFGIPLIKSIMDLKKSLTKGEEESEESYEDRPLYALIISPTRELALQIKDHIQTAAKYTNIQCVSVVGGLATAKQERLLSKCPEIIVGTPGRLHKLLTDGCAHLNKFESLKHLVIDEADRMLEQGHFKELTDILEMMNRVKVKRQIFVLSATLTIAQHHKSYKKNVTNQSEMQQFIDKIGLNPKAKVIDLTTKHVTATQLRQLRVMCADEEKEIYLAYFLMTHPGRTIIFVNSISCTHRLCSLLSLLGFTPLQLHSGKQQRQRLKYLERFTASESGLLIATDVAARGLDIPKVCNVVHFQLPSNPKVYIHRSGRTARANEAGLSFILEGPADFTALKKITVVLKLGKDIPSLKVDRKILDGIKARVSLAREIDRENHKLRKENADNNWLKRAADSMDIETEEEEKKVLSKREKLQQNAKRKQLQKLLSEELYPTGFSGCYPTQSGSLIVPGLQTLL